MLVRSQSPCC